MIISTELVTRILDTVDQGLIKGLGEPIPGKMCVEAAVNYAMGQPHGDDPSCVGCQVRAFKVLLNDSDWSSDQARAVGMRKLAIAQLGSNTIDQTEFVKLIVLGTAQRILPIIFHKAGLDEEAIGFKNIKSIEDVEPIGSVAYSSSYKFFNDEPRKQIMRIAYYSAVAIMRAVIYKDDNDGHHTAIAECVSTCDTLMFQNELLLYSADIALQALKTLKSPGCEYLHMCD